MPSSRKPSAGAALLRLLWQIPLYSIPFGVFFGTIFGASGKARGDDKRFIMGDALCAWWGWDRAA